MRDFPHVPVLETNRLVLRGWRQRDVEAYAALLGDPPTARFITRGGRPYTAAQAWAETCFMIGHWHLRGFGMFVVEEKGSGAFVGRVGPLEPDGWPGLEIAWALVPAATGQGYATEAASAALAWVFETQPVSRIVSLIHPANMASQRVALRLGENKTGQGFAPLGEDCEIWELRRSAWHPVGSRL